MGEVMVGEAEASAGADAPALRRNPWNGALATLCLVALVAAGALGLWSRAAFSEGAADRHQAVASADEQADLVRQEAATDQHRRDLGRAADDVSNALNAYADDVVAASDDASHLVEVQNQAVDLLSQGRRGAGVDVLTSQGDPLVADLTQKVADLHAALTDLEAKVQTLQAQLDG